MLKTFLIQICVLANHQNGKDTHLRAIRIFSPQVEGAMESGISSANDILGRDMDFTSRDFLALQNIR